MPFPRVQIKPGEKLDLAFARSAKQIAAAGNKVSTLEQVNGVMFSRDFARYFWVERGKPTDLFLVCVAPWTDNDVLLVLNDLWRLRESVGGGLHFHILSAHEVPLQIAYFTRDGSGAAFSFNLMVEIEGLVQSVISSASADAIGQTAAAVRSVASKHFGGAWSLDTLETLNRIDELVLREMRTQTDAEAPDEGYEPIIAIFGVGCAAAEVIMRQIKGRSGIRAEWTTSPLLPTKFPVIKMSVNKTALQFSPVEKSLKLFKNGKGD